MLISTKIILVEENMRKVKSHDTVHHYTYLSSETIMSWWLNRRKIKGS
jgi:hypothetical protein